MVRVNGCCCCCSLETGVLVLGYLSLISGAVNIIMIVNNPNQVYSSAVSAVMSISVGLLEVIGGHKRNPKLLRAAFIIGVIWLIIGTIMAVIIIALAASAPASSAWVPNNNSYGSRADENRQRDEARAVIAIAVISIAVALAITMGFQIYCLIVVRSFYLELEESAKNSSSRQMELPAAYPPPAYPPNAYPPMHNAPTGYPPQQQDLPGDVYIHKERV